MAAHPVTYAARSSFCLLDPNVENTMIDIIVDGPQPMLKRKPANRVRNGAELFNQTHQADYESRGQQTSDWLQRVRYHNQSYPVLYDELNRKKSMTRMSKNVGALSANTYNWKFKNKQSTGRISKQKYRKKFYYSTTNIGCQYELPKQKVKLAIRENPECSRKISKINQEGKKDDIQKGSGSKLDLDRDNSRPSVTTFNSVVSMTNEPMVAEQVYYS